MLGLVISVIVFNTLAFLLVKRLSKNEIVHIWLFTTLFHGFVDLILSLKYEAYWYFNHVIGWSDIPAIALLSPPAALLFLNGYPAQDPPFKRVFYILLWSLIVTGYEAITLLPEPWGFFNHGWWKLKYSALVYPVLFCIVLLYYKWICRIDEEENSKRFDHFSKE